MDDERGQSEAGERAEGLEEDSEELPSRVIHVERDVWRASRLEYITKNVRAGRYQVDMERLADTLLPQLDALTRRRK